MLLNIIITCNHNYQLEEVPLLNIGIHKRMHIQDLDPYMPQLLATLTSGPSMTRWYKQEAIYYYNFIAPLSIS